MSIIRILHVGDIVGEHGVQAAIHLLPELISARAIDFTILNGENAHLGRGLNERIVKKFYKAGVDVVTGGDHSFDKHLIFGYMKKDTHLLRPMNYPPGVPGYGYGVFSAVEAGVQIGVINLRGNAFFHNPIHNPFSSVDQALNELQPYTQLLFVDFHAEATAEKIAMGRYLDGRVSVVSGTHTHVQTGDERIFPEGTGYLSDVGFTGAHESVIGLDIETAIDRQRLQIPRKYKPASEDVKLQGAIYEVDDQSGHCLRVERLSVDCPPEVTAHLVVKDDGSLKVLETEESTNND